ncbi:putative RNA-directed DNA polymerase [Helianthus annuus]|nr:putative RNA-directed DNA polymerase [Helianthus annuus]KAJ0630492.1 putative RNA-directed DNA polymerase [Helianthus annuus]KAJ0769065.1 putative RNA-directed DNA polymerase [Helianthus annuus]KAJ0936892.1 putative RNA-directed DNA polymerase [Helianthus annuus]
MEILSCMFVKVRDGGATHGIKTPNNGPIISHLLYADDAIIMGEWEAENLLNVVRILRVFYMCSMLKINLKKSNLYGIGVGNSEVKDKAKVVGCIAGETPFNYFSLILGANMNRINNWKPVFNVFEARLSSWKANTLSMGGRVFIIKSILESFPSYYFSLYMAPVKVITDLEKLIRRFLWGGSNGASKMHWVSWDQISMPKEDGGIGICKLRFRGELGNGQGIAFWTDPWLENEPLKDIYPNIFKLESKKRCKVADRLSAQEGSLNVSRKWRKGPENFIQITEFNWLCRSLDSVQIREGRNQWK